LLPIAVPVGNGRDWILDVKRVLRPDHPGVELLLKRLDQLDRTIWKAEPEGSVWDRQVLGRNWVRYQTVAAGALYFGVGLEATVYFGDFFTDKKKKKQQEQPEQ
ncbi:MAG TPA: hypothetical protein PLA94_28070, partial [Myxococcota bacterium]|nr:hypothetical protein [Myxococcota bacterium]